MDPATAAAFAAQFIGLAGQALQGISWLRTLFQDIRSAPGLIKRIHNELKIFEGILSQLSKLEHSHVNHDAAQTLTATLLGCDDVFGCLAAEISQHDFAKYEGGPKRLWKQILANDKRSEFEEYLRNLERIKTSLLASMAGMQLAVTNDIRNDFATHAHRVDKSFGRVELGVSSVYTISKDIQRNTMETQTKIEEFADVLRNMDKTIQDLRADIPALLDRSVQRFIGSKLVDWVNNAEFEDSGQKASSYINKFPLPSHDPVQDESTNSQSHLVHSNSLLVLTHNTESIRPSSTERKFGYIPRSSQTHTGIDACFRTKTQTRNFPLPIGFIEIQTTQRMCQNTPTNGCPIQIETLRMEITLIPFRWLSTKGHVVSLEKVIDQYNRPSWTYTPRSYHVVPDNAMIVSACQRQDLNAIQKLFQYQQASPFDVCASGKSLMAITINNLDIEGLSFHTTQAKDTINFLISQGADPTRFMGEFLDIYSGLFNRSMYYYFGSVDQMDRESVNAAILEDIWKLCLEHCQTDPFVNTSVLEKLWDASLGGKNLPCLDGTYLFQERHAGLEDLVFKSPENVFTSLMGASIPNVSDKTWQRLVDQHYETLLYLCDGDDDSIKARVFSMPFTANVPWNQDSCFCPSTGSHLLFQILNHINHYRYKPLQALRHRHLHRMLVLLLQSGEDPEASCSCKSRWQYPEGFRSVTDVAAGAGVLKTWSTALEETGFDATRILDEWRFEGVSDMFDPPQENSSSMEVLKIVGSAFLSTISYIV